MIRIIIISLLNPLVVYNTKLQGRSRIRRTHNYTWQEAVPMSDIRGLWQQV